MRLLLAILVALAGLPKWAMAQPSQQTELASTAEIVKASPPSRHDKLFELANTAGQEAYMSEEEKTVILLINYARLDGSFFVDNYLNKAADTLMPFVQALRNKLNAQSPLSPLRPAFGLFRSANLQASWLGSTGKTGTSGPEGETYTERIHRSLPGAQGYGSSYWLGSGDPFEVVMGMLVGSGDTIHSYHTQLLHPGLRFVGVAIKPHARHCLNTVVDMSAPQMKVAEPRGKKRKQQEAYFLDCPKSTHVIRAKRRDGILGWIF